MPALARCLRYGKQRSICAVPGCELTRGRAVSPALAALEPAVAMREAPCGGTARVWPNGASARGASDRALHHLRRPARGLRAHLLRCLPARVPARLLVQDAHLLPELPPEARAAVGRVGRAKRTSTRGAPAVRVHAAQT